MVILGPMKKRFDERYQNTQSIQDVLEKILNSPALGKGIRETRAINAWEQVLGPTISRITKSLNIRGGVLYVRLNSSVIRNDLLMHKDKIIDALNAEAGGKVVYDLVVQ